MYTGLKRTRRMLGIWLVLFLGMAGFYLSGPVQAQPSLSASSAVVIDQQTGQILYNKHMHIRRPPASTTKILTAIIALEMGNEGEIVTVSQRAATQEGSSIWLKAGEKLTLKELIYAILLASGNDAAVAIAEHIGGSIAGFARIMNEKARELGACNSNFTNPSGLPEPGHMSTAHDLGLIMRYALNNETFARITATKYTTISWPGHDWDRGLRNHNKLLWSYEGCIGGKTGYTRAAGRCLVSAACRDGRGVVAVVLNSPSDWLDSTGLLDFGLDSFVYKTVVEAGERVYSLPWEQSREGDLIVVARDPVQLAVPRGGQLEIKREILLQEELELPVRRGQPVGKLLIYEDRGQRVIGKTDLEAGCNLNHRSPILYYWHKIVNYIKKITPENRN